MLDLEMIGQGATTKIYRDGGTAVKLYVDAPPDEADNEAKKQAFARAAGLPVPEVYGVRVLDEHRTALDMAYIPGQPLMHRGIDRDERNRAIETLVRLQRLVHGADGGDLPGQAERLARKIRRCPYVAEPVRDAVLDLLNRLDDGSRSLCHGDFHGQNVLFDGERHWIIDWVNATAGSPLADACRTYILFRQFISRSAEIYLRLFCKAAGVTREAVLAWLPVVAVARLSEGMDDRGRALLTGLVNDWYLQNCGGSPG